MSSTSLTVVTDPDETPDSTQATAENRSRPADAAYMHPDDVLIADNVRTTYDLADHPEQIASIREFGVGLPIRAERDPDGTVHAIDGQLRVLIAREVGLAEIPVWIVDAPTGDDRERRIARTLTQINLNDRRLPLTARDRAAGVAQMLDLGASVTRVAKGLQTNRAEVKRSAAIGRSATAQQLLGGHQFGLDQLAVIAEYENLGDTDAVERLSRATRYNFTYTRNQIDAERAETRDLLHAALPWATYGFGVLTNEPDTGSAEAAYVPDELLASADGEPVSESTILADPDRWVVYLTVEENGLLVDTTTGEIVDYDAVDWNTDSDSEATPADGYRHADTVEYRDRWSPHYYLPTAQLSGSGLHRLTDPAPEVAEHTRLAAEQAVAAREAATRERRMVRELNRRGQSAKDRRLDLLPKLVAKATAPAGAAAFVARAHAHRLAPKPLALVTELLGLSGGRDALLAAIDDASENRAATISVAIELAVHETDIDKTLWRHPTAATGRYLRFLDAIGDSYEFGLVDVEHAALGDVEPADIDLAPA
ncbi:ParB/RepB/Spo0J family partition protein [Nocardia fusca]|uniref:ParB/RepB/Spo0J family partition protein n=1 Tax=Nocardia fusca TaxID=941183 RepID=UPI0007A742AA|nr:ParB/RepB/Spo0J family partition protein [Nocardia fusca]